MSLDAALQPCASAREPQCADRAHWIIEDPASSSLIPSGFMNCGPFVSVRLADEFLNYSGDIAASMESLPPTWLQQVTSTVCERFRENVTLAELAGLAGVHAAHVSRTFRRFYGKSPGNVARELRVRLVCEQLADRTRSLAELASEAGFADQAHMTRTFVRLVGVTPGKLRAALR